jgi:hypothetical protein
MHYSQGERTQSVAGSFSMHFAGVGAVALLPCGVVLGLDHHGLVSRTQIVDVLQIPDGEAGHAAVVIGLSAAAG